MMDTTLRPQMHWEQVFDARLGRSHPEMCWTVAAPAVRQAPAVSPDPAASPAPAVSPDPAASPEPVVPAPAASRELAPAAA